ncbi:uncharacterized protein G2W53_010846 [Senna tora]|uniref:Uncharacterized protein n=1 Tax=Senna tora TaxID=362788 RepID=A0A834X0E5_9FABA|nr:uncharacterized protein G2W53_010846 [Senna tora]
MTLSSKLTSSDIKEFPADIKLALLSTLDVEYENTSDGSSGMPDDNKINIVMSSLK